MCSTQLSRLVQPRSGEPPGREERVKHRLRRNKKMMARHRRNLRKFFVRMRGRHERWSWQAETGLSMTG